MNTIRFARGNVLPGKIDTYPVSAEASARSHSRARAPRMKWPES